MKSQVEFHWARVPHLFCTFAAVAVLMALTSCTTTSSGDSSADYTPLVTPIEAGFRPILPHYSAEVTYCRCQYLSESEMTDIQRHFVQPLLHGDYQLHIAAIVVYGSYEPAQTRFGIWLHDGRHLNSGNLFFGADDRIVPQFAQTNIGRPMFDCAIRLLREAIPDTKLRRDRQTMGFASLHSRTMVRQSCPAAVTQIPIYWTL